MTGMAWADAGVGPGGTARLQVTANDLDQPWMPTGRALSFLTGSHIVYAVRMTGRLTAVDPECPDAHRARTLGRHPPCDESSLWGIQSDGLPLEGATKELRFDLDESVDVHWVQPVLTVLQKERRDRYVGPPLAVWPAPTFLGDAHWDAPDPGAFRPSERLNTVSVDEGTDLTVVVRVRPDDDVRDAELRVRVWAVAGGAQAIMDAVPKAGWVPQVWQDVFVRVRGEGPDPFGDLRFRWRAARHEPTERAVAYLRSAAPQASDPYGSGRSPVYLGWVRVNGVVRQLPPLDIVGPALEAGTSDS